MDQSKDSPRFDLEDLDPSDFGEYFAIDCSSEKAFLEAFEIFCGRGLPGNLRLRERLVQLIQTAPVVLKPFSWYQRETLLPPLPEPWPVKTTETFSEANIPKVTIDGIGFNCSLLRLKPGKMINDEVVSAYLRLVRKASGALISTSRLIEPAFGSTSRPDPLDRDTTINYPSLNAYGQLLIPIHLDVHWAFARVQPLMSSLIVEYYDSLNYEHPQKLDVWLSQRFPGLTIVHRRGDSPLQRNDVDCGLFMLLGIRLIAFGSYHLQQGEAEKVVPKFRHRALAEILADVLNPSTSDYDIFSTKDREAATIATGGEDDRLSDDVEFLLEREKGDGDIQLLSRISSENLDISYTDGALTGSSTMESEINPSGETTLFIEEAPTFERAPDTSVMSVDKLKVEWLQTTTITHNHQGQSPLSYQSPLSHQSDLIVDRALSSFANQHSMVEMLKDAVVTYRNQLAVSPNEETLAALWLSLADDDNPQHKLFYRYKREKFSRAFNAKIGQLGGKQRVPARIRSQMQDLLKCGRGKNAWKAAQALASRAKVWTELIEVFRPYPRIKDAGVALYAVSDQGFEKMDQ